MKPLSEQAGPGFPCDIRVGRRRARLRMMMPADAATLIAFFDSHTEETVRERYGYLVNSMTAERAASLVGVDQTRDLALGVFEAGPQGESLDAVGRYCLDPGGRSAEFALVVRETKRRLGLGELLLRTLIAAARARGLAEVWGQIAVDNAAMLQMVRQLGFTLSSEDGRSDRASLFLQPPSGRSASLQPSQYR